VVASSGQSDDLAASIVSASRISLQRASIGQKIILKYQAIWGILLSSIFSAALMVRAMRTAIQCSSDLDAVSDDLAITMGTRGGHLVNGAFEAIEGQRLFTLSNLEGFVVLVSTDITLWHKIRPFLQPPGIGREVFLGNRDAHYLPVA
jgi:hypothetical protein